MSHNSSGNISGIFKSPHDCSMFEIAESSFFLSSETCLQDIMHYRYCAITICINVHIRSNVTPKSLNSSLGWRRPPLLSVFQILGALSLFSLVKDFSSIRKFCRNSNFASFSLKCCFLQHRSIKECIAQPKNVLNSISIPSWLLNEMF